MPRELILGQGAAARQFQCLLLGRCGEDGGAVVVVLVLERRGHHKAVAVRVATPVNAVAIFQQDAVALLNVLLKAVLDGVTTPTAPKAATATATPAT